MTIEEKTTLQGPPGERIHPVGNRHRVPTDLGLTIVLGILGFLTIIPVLMLLQLSTKTEQQMADHMWLPAFPLHLNKYLSAWYQIDQATLNSATFVVGTVIISITCSTLSAYSFARYDAPGKEFFFIAVLMLMMIPGILTLMTRFMVVLKLGLNNTNWGIWLPMAAGAQAFQIIILRTFFESIPEEFFEAMRLDGAGEFRMLTAIALPMAKPILTTLVVLQCNSVWNEYIWPIIVLADWKKYPVVLAILQFAIPTDHLYDRGAMFASYVLAGLPLVLLFSVSSRYFIRGLTSGAIKM